MINIRIEPLENQPQEADVVAEWISREWRQLAIHAYLAAVSERRPPISMLPRTLVALDKQTERGVGTVSSKRGYGNAP
jgi:hypothetical protein